MEAGTKVTEQALSKLLKQQLVWFLKYFTRQSKYSTNKTG